MAISAILIVVFGLTAFFLVRGIRNNLSTGLNRESEAFAALATKPIGDTYGLYSQSGTLLIKQQMQKFATLDPNVSNIAVVNLEGLSQFSLTGSPINVPTEAVTSFDSTIQSNSHNQIVLAVQPYISDSGQHSYSLVYQISPALVERTIAHQELVILALTLLGLLLSAAAAYEFINYFFLAPINKLNQMAQVVAAGDYEKQVDSDRKDEIGTLTRSINYMADTLKSDISRLQELDKQKNEFIMIASHNLRTPLTIIRGYISMLEDAKLDDRLQSMVQAVEESARKLNEFSEEMLVIASLESPDNAKQVLEPIALDELLKPIIDEYNEQAYKGPFVFKPMVTEGQTKVNANRSQLSSAIRNLLDNAFKFSHKNGEVDFIAGPENGKVRITVRDHGIGIKEEEMPKLFTKFHRGNELLLYNYEGTGIGLYTTKLIVEKHHGSIYVQSKLGVGSTFMIELPLSNPDLTQLI